MADEFDLGGLKSALGLPKGQSNEPFKVEIRGTSVSKSEQFERDVKALKSLQDELEKEKKKAAKGDQFAIRNVEALNREIARKGGQSVPQVAPTEAPSDSFDISGLKTAISGGFAPSQEETTATKAPPVKRLFEPKTELDKSLMQGIEALPGSKELGAFGNVAAGTISQSVGAVQQLLGKYFPSLSDEQRNAIVENATKNVTQTQEAIKPMQEESPKAALAGEVTGFIANPINKLVPGFGGPAQSITGAITKGAGQGAIANVLTTPVISEEQPFFSQKLNQALTGGAFGGGFSAGVHLFGNALGKSYDAVKKQFGGSVPAGELDNAATKIIAESGIDVTKVPQSFFTSLKDQAKNALQTGDVKSFKQFAQNYSEANSLKVPVPMLRGQLTRDPMQYAVEQNLRGVQNVGEPIQAVLQKQNTALIQNLDEFGAKLGQDVTNSGFTLRNALQATDRGEAQKVRDAYTAFKNSTGKDITVPLQGLAQDYAKVVKDFGRSTLPEGVRNNLESLGLIKGKQLKLTTIEDAEALIKNINQNYDKTKPVQMNALDQLRRSVENSIREAGANLPGEAGAVAREARKAASDRFATIESIPALKDALKGNEPDKFVQKHILQGNVSEIDKMTKYLQANNPEALAQIQNDVMRLIKNRVTNNVSDENAKFSQAQLKKFLTDETGQKLSKFLSAEQMNGLRQLNRVAENALIEPVSSAVNKSNTASAAANLVQGTVKSGAVNELLSNIASIKFPGVAWGANALRDLNQQARSAELIQQAVNPAAPKPTQIKTMIKPGVAGAGAGQGMIQQQNLQFEKERQ
jgi:hypothetical protein